ncbi:MAG: hypothetical protein A2788_00365 [Candidatus Abawacabacteria bacterium RIFCSPHIGHO2_01_FULL_46_8]|uniref:GH15-like domain-containing protein n=1 Tax=Candidatus Abawacabacteria bacterium RIFCSPHIGHO2_01_FULL_46_8 TaxID=1817815 RepID=A0A1F4XM48_9BACT|nr:MAG: hypothetical protein A2788_00365 [Candidatus Abawacabacteria bacterium RIFCSPHIGHO2_01_FULL_46_8]
MAKKELKIPYQKLIDQHRQILKSLQKPSGLFIAAKQDVATGYDKAWLRDNFYECLAFEVLDDWEVVLKTYRAILDIFIKHEDKIDYAIARKPGHTHEYIHARYHPETFAEFWEEWGNKQNDAIGAILFKIGQLEHVHGLGLIKNRADERIVQKLVDYLVSIEYWQDPDNGVWEEAEELHASSVGACVAGLKSIRQLSFVSVPDDLIEKGERTLARLLPRESAKKFVDLALLTLIYPYRVVTDLQAQEILANVEYHLLRKRGVIRYKGDHYYNKNRDGHSEEAEWCFGVSWLAIIHKLLGDEEKAREFMERALATITSDGEIPELYFSNSARFNDNTPLGWAESMFVIALYYYQQKNLTRPKS